MPSFKTCLFPTLPSLAAAGLLTSLLGFSASAAAVPFNPDTDWLHDARYGVFMHVLLDGEASLDTVNSFDVNALADQLVDVQTGYLVLTLGQNSGYFNAPNPTYESIAGYAAGTRCAAGDLPQRLLGALKPRGIRLMLYLPAQTPNDDTTAQAAFGLSPQQGSNRPLDTAFAEKWAEVIRYWSMRYGADVSGWWFDGGYRDIFNAEIAQIYADAVHAGNPHGIVTFNPGIELIHYNDVEDYTAGEINEPLELLPTSRWVDGSQWHALTYLGSYWSESTTRFTSQQWADWAKSVVDGGGVISFDARLRAKRPELGDLGTRARRAAPSDSRRGWSASDTACRRRW